MKKSLSIFLIILILLVNQNIHIYQNWCNGENIGYTINAKRFNFYNDSIPLKSYPIFSKDKCCKDVLIKSNNNNSFFSFEKTLQISLLSFNGIFNEFNFDLHYTFLTKDKKIPQLYSKPPPDKVKLYQYYCCYTYYG